MNNLETVLTAVVASIGGAALIVGGLAAWLGSVWKDRIERQEGMLIGIDVDLRTRRITVYEQLWALTEVLPKWPRDETLTYERLKTFAEELRHWYFHVGGIYLSRSSREGYGAPQDDLAKVLQSGRTGKVMTEPTDDYEALRSRCNQLRTLLAADIESRRESTSKSKK